ncbi:hypothetical protein MVEN_01281700 [Mycena venus]|uniref:Uncharacterized protein n=1 Tax=Mycena venus TaxID=2733690 RepID=A0A8H6XX13_9AGAR|nr:hypothetical protein MVEN_01281700 [Mycena venus]
MEFISAVFGSRVNDHPTVDSLPCINDRALEETLALIQCPAACLCPEISPRLNALAGHCPTLHSCDLKLLLSHTEQEVLLAARATPPPPPHFALFADPTSPGPASRMHAGRDTTPASQALLMLTKQAQRLSRPVNFLPVAAPLPSALSHPAPCPYSSSHNIGNAVFSASANAHPALLPFEFEQYAQHFRQLQHLGSPPALG